MPSIYRSIVVGMARQINPDRRIGRFLLVGILNTGFSYSTYYVTLHIWDNYILASTAATLLGIIFSFKTHGRFVFNNPANGLIWRFVTGWFAIYLLSLQIIGTMIYFGISALCAGALALPLNVCLSYIISRYFVFRGSAQSRAGGLLGGVHDANS